MDGGRPTAVPPTTTHVAYAPIAMNDGGDNHYQPPQNKQPAAVAARQVSLDSLKSPETTGSAAAAACSCRPSAVDGVALRSQSCRQSCWKRRTPLEKRLLGLLVVLFVVGIALVVIAACMNVSHSLKDRTDSTSQICLTEHCVKTAARLLEAMDPTVDPCDDFFEYACGSWNRINVIPNDKPKYDTFRKLGDELQTSLKVLLENPVSKDDPAAIVNIKHLYQSCLDTNMIELRDHQPLTDVLLRLGGWPVLDADWNPETFDLELLLAKLRLYSNRVLINAWVGADDKNSDVNIIMLDQAQLGMPSRDYFLKGRDDKTLLTYQEFAIEVAVAMGTPPVRARKEMSEMVDFEIQLANMTIPEEYRRDAEAMYSRLSVADLYNNITTDFDWLKYLRTVFSSVNLEIDLTEEVVVYANSYLARLATMLRRTSNRTLANYVIWHFVMNRISSMPQRFLDLRRNFNKAMHGVDQEQARWRTCVNYVNENFGMAVGRIFIEKYFSEESKSNALGMIQNIRSAFAELLEEVPWMDSATRVVAKEKADSIQEKIGYPDYIMNDTALNLDYVGITINSTQFFENVLSSLNFAAKGNFKFLRKPVDRVKWSTAPAVVNAFYSATKNQIMFPAGILQPPFYHKNYPKYLQFSGIAIAVGHEITHGFDDEGRQYDKDGNLKQWWSDSVIEKFKEKAQCIIDQYSNYVVPEAGLNLNGRQTQGENIADNGGLKQAFRAYKRWVERNNLEPLLPGLNMTHDQLFYLNFAQVFIKYPNYFLQIWCGTARPESYVQSIRIGRHSPGRFRVIGSVSNSPDFAASYNCPVGSRMNPVHKCSVW